MRIEITTEGGIGYFPGLAKPTIIDTAQLSAADARELGRLADEAHVFDRPEQDRPPPRGAADYRTYSINIERGGQRHSLRTSDLTADPGLMALIKFVREKERELQSPKGRGSTP